MSLRCFFRSCFSRPVTQGLVVRLFVVLLASSLGLNRQAHADSVNSPNITMNVDTNRSAGAGAGNTAIAINTITIAETMLGEYASGAGKAITLKVRPGFQFDATSDVSALSATIGINGTAVNAAAVLTPSGAADEVLTFNLTSGTNASVQDVIRISGIKLKILSAIGAAGPAQTTMDITTSTAGGAFTNQGIVASSITKGTPDRLEFSVQPGTTQSIEALVPTVSMVDFGGNIVTGDDRQITLTIQSNPGAATLSGASSQTTIDGVAAWSTADNLNIATASTGYTLRASHAGAAFHTSDTVDSGAFDILAGAPNRLSISMQPVSTDAGAPILIDVSVLDGSDNLVTSDPVDVTLSSVINPGGWPLLADSSLTKTTVNGVASWEAADNLRINKAVAAYKLAASGLGEPAETDPFDITPADPSHTAITQQPVTSMVGDNLLVAVAVQDEFNNVVTDTPTDVRLDLSTNPGAATLEVATSLTKTTVAGVASWEAADALRINVAASGYRILASGVWAAEESDAFDITETVVDPMEVMDACGANCGASGLMACVPMVGWAFVRRRRRSRVRTSISFGPAFYGCGCFALAVKTQERT